MKSKHPGRKAALAALLALSLIITACTESTASDDLETAEAVTPVKVAVVEQGTLTMRNEIIGITKPNKSVDVYPKMAGELAELYVSRGDYIEAGAKLGAIDTENLRVQIQQGEAALAQAQTQLKNAQLGLEQAKSNHERKILTEPNAESDGTNHGEDASAASENGAAAEETQTADVSSHGEESLAEAEELPAESQPQAVNRVDLELQNIKLQLEQARTNLERMENLYAEGLISQQQYEQAVNAVRQTEIAYQQVLLAMQDENSAFAVQQAEIGVELAQIQVNQAQLNLNQARKQLADATITAPISGQVVAVNADPGELVSMQMPLVTIISTNPIIVTAEVNVRQLMLLQGLEEVEVEIPDLGRTYTARVTYLSPIANTGGFYTIEAELENPDDEIRAGMVSKIILDQSLVENSLIVPTTAIIERSDGAFVYVVRDERAVRVNVEILEQQTDKTAVAGELSPGDQVVTTGQMTLSDDQRVRIIDGEARNH